MVGSGIVTSAINAALANGMLAHSDETDDSNGSAGIHPGCAIIPAALAMAERENASGEAFVRAVILGYDIGSRTTKALGRDAMRARNHLPFSIGTLGATAAASAARSPQRRAVPASALLRRPAGFRSDDLRTRYGAYRKGLHLWRNARPQ